MDKGGGDEQGEGAMGAIGGNTIEQHSRRHFLKEHNYYMQKYNYCKNII